MEDFNEIVEVKSSAIFRDIQGDSARRDNLMKVQLEFSFEKRFESLKEVIVHSVFKSDIPVKTLAGRLDHSPSNLSRRLSLATCEGEPSLSVEDFEGIMAATENYTPIYYLIEKFIKQAEEQELSEFRELKKRLPELKRLIATLEGK